MQFQKQISFESNPQHGGSQLVGKFLGDNTTSDQSIQIEVKGTNDITIVKFEKAQGSLTQVVQGTLTQVLGGKGDNDHDNHDGNDDCHDGNNNGHDDNHSCSGNWESKDKYQSLQQTLVLLQNNVSVQEASYDQKGMLLPTPPPTTTGSVTVSDFSGVNNGGLVSITWTTTFENLVASYNLSRTSQDGTVTYVQKGIPVQGPSTYPTIQDIPGTGVFTYNLEAVYSDANSTTAIVKTFTITI
jgi:hypothetical protein